MSLPRYPKYKDSGVPWLGEVPEHWGFVQSRRLFALRKEGARPDDEQLTASQTHGVIFQDDFMEREGRAVVRVIHGADILKHVEPNDFVISMRSFQGGIEWCGLRGCISSAYVMLIPTSDVVPHFFRYLFKSDRYIQALQSTTNLVRDGQAMRYSNFTQLDLPVVPANEQTAIAAFLDRETAKIDALVAEQRRLIELLKEKRQAVISHAVTKGLNPAAPMKDSGIEWLGEVPEHWEITRLKLLSEKIGSGKTPLGGNEVYVSEGVLFLRSQNVYDEGLRLDDAVFIATEIDQSMENTRVKGGDILLNVTGASIGRTCLVPNPFVPANVNQHVCIIRICRGKLRPFIALALKGNAVKSQITLAQTGAARDGLNFDQIGNFVFALPKEYEESQAIVSFIGRETNKFDQLITEATHAIDLLQERRTTLISAAVTGKIDVREMAKAQTA